VSGEDTDVEEMLLDLIRDRIANHERSQQTAIGASEIGTPCARKLALKLAMQVGDVEPVPEQMEDDKWRATVGIAVHAWLAEMLRAENERYEIESRTWSEGTLCHEWCELGEPDEHGLTAPIHRDRYLIEHHTPIGTINGEPVPGNLDVFDRHTKTMVDWKIVGPTAIKTYKRDQHPGDEYEVQVQLYGRGLSRVHPVEDVRYVGIMFLPSNGELNKNSFYWETEFDPEVGKAALKRAREIQNLLDDRGLAIIPELKTVDDHCNHCPFFSPGTDDVEHECPGDPSLVAKADEQLADLFPNGLP
jgi:hypothetical protein